MYISYQIAIIVNRLAFIFEKSFKEVKEKRFSKVAHIIKFRTNPQSKEIFCQDLMASWPPKIKRAIVVIEISQNHQIARISRGVVVRRTDGHSKEVRSSRKISWPWKIFRHRHVLITNESLFIKASTNPLLLLLLNQQVDKHHQGSIFFLHTS